MSKPIRDIEIVAPDESRGTVKAVFDTGSFYSLVRQDRVPGGAFTPFKTPRSFRGAGVGMKLTAAGELLLVLRIGQQEIDDVVLVSPDLAQEMLVGAGTMQKWDVSILNRDGHTEVVVGRDMHDPQITEID